MTEHEALKAGTAGVGAMCEDVPTPIPPRLRHTDQQAYEADPHAGQAPRPA